MVAGEGEDLVVLEAGQQSLRSAPIELGELPVHVLSGQRSGTLDAKARASLVQAHRRTASQHPQGRFVPAEDRKSTRLNSSHVAISYAVFCLKKKKKSYTNIKPN